MQNVISRPTIGMIMLLALLPALLVACASPAQTQALPGSLEVTSATETGSINYLLTGTVELPDSGPATLRYSLNGDAPQETTLIGNESFGIPLTLREGSNLIEL